MKHDHNPPANADWSICVFGGSQDGLAKLFELFMDEYDSLMVESPTYRQADPTFLIFLKTITNRVNIFTLIIFCC